MTQRQLPPELEKFFKKHRKTCAYYVFSGDRHCSCGRDKAWEYIMEKFQIEQHYFVTPQDVKFPDNRFCAECGEYLTHPNHKHARECTCKECKIRKETDNGKRRK